MNPIVQHPSPIYIYPLLKKEHRDRIESNRIEERRPGHVSHVECESAHFPPHRQKLMTVSAPRCLTQHNTIPKRQRQWERERQGHHHRLTYLRTPKEPEFYLKPASGTRHQTRPRFERTWR